MNTRDVLEMRPDLIHSGDVQAFESFIKTLVGFGDFFDAPLDHAGSKKDSYHTGIHSTEREQIRSDKLFKKTV
jgi:hypothetical protein